MFVNTTESTMQLQQIQIDEGPPASDPNHNPGPTEASGELVHKLASLHQGLAGGRGRRE